MSSGLKSLPKNISAHPDGLLVRIKLGAVLFQAFIPKTHKTPLARALALRKKFLALAGPAKQPKRLGVQQVRSNTGVAGVSETTMWRHDRPYPCFSVDWSVAGRHQMKRIHYGGSATSLSRPEALRVAIALREQMTGVAS